MSTVKPDSPQIQEAAPFSGRVSQLRSLLSFVLALGVLAFFGSRLELDLNRIWETIKSANAGLLVLAFIVYYSAFLLRGLRWRLLLENVGLSDKAGVPMPSLLGLSRMLYLSWFANCVIPAKLGDAYRSYQLKQEAGVSFSTAMGTVLAERFMDMVVLVVLLVAAFWGLGRIGTGNGEASTHIIVGGVLVLALGMLGLGSMWLLRRWFHTLLPRRIQAQYLRFQEGTLGSFRNLPIVFLLSLAVWLAEASRLFLVASSLNLDLSVPFVIFVVLANSLLTIVPFTPGGLGLVEAGMVGLLLFVGIGKEVAVAAALLDRTISYWSIVVLGFLMFLVRRKV